jgi:type IV fimbrial biogenesis protein FimT
MLTRRPQSGFNLIELMVAIAIMSVLIFGVMPSFADWIKSARMRGVAESIQHGLHRARHEAIQRNRNVTFWLMTPGASGTLDANCARSASSASWVVSIDDPTGKCDQASSLSVAPRMIESHSGGNAAQAAVMAKTATTADPTGVTFNGLGQRILADHMIEAIDITQASGNGRRLRVRISTTGSVRTCDLDVPSGDPRSCGLMGDEL